MSIEMELELIKLTTFNMQITSYFKIVNRNVVILQIISSYYTQPASGEASFT